MLVSPSRLMGGSGLRSDYMKSGTILSGTREGNIVDGGRTLIIDLLGGLTWHANVGSDSAETTALIDGMVGEEINATDWNSVVNPAMDFNDVDRTSATRVTITMPAVGTYVVDEPETITVTVPASCVVGKSEDLLPFTFTIAEYDVTFAISGTAPNATEAQVRAGGRTIIVDLTDGDSKWEATIGADNAFTDALLASFAGDDAGSLGWDDTINGVGGLDFNDVTRNSDTRVTITIDTAAGSDYNAVGTETVTCTLSPTCIENHSTTLGATDSFDLVEEALVVTATMTVDEDDIRTAAAAASIIITITTPSDGIWAATAAEILAGLTFSGSLSESDSWNTSGPAILAAHVTRDSATQVTVDLPAADDYAINANETLTVTVAAAALQAYGGASANDTITITNLTPAASLSGTVTTADKADIQAGTTTLIIDLTAHKWVESFTDAVKNAIIAGISGDAVADGWDDEITVPTGNVVRTDDDTVTITVPQTAGYNPVAAETITVTVPAAAVHNYASALGDQTFEVTAGGDSFVFTWNVTCAVLGGAAKAYVGPGFHGLETVHGAVGLPAPVGLKVTALYVRVLTNNTDNGGTIDVSKGTPGSVAATDVSLDVPGGAGAGDYNETAEEGSFSAGDRILLGIDLSGSSSGQMEIACMCVLAEEI